MKKLSLLIIPLLCLATFTGCISRRADVKVVIEVPKFDDSNSRVVTVPGAEFSVRLPEELTLMKDLDENGAQLYSVISVTGNKNAKFMFIESTTNALDASVDLLDSVEGVTVLNREETVKAGYVATKVVTKLAARPKEETPYFFLEANGRTYIFSLPAGAPWQYFESVINSFQRN